MQFSTSRRSALRTTLVSSLALIFGMLAMGANPAAADTLDDVTKSGVIKVGIFEDFPPFASLGSDMKI